MRPVPSLSEVHGLLAGRHNCSSGSDCGSLPPSPPGGAALGMVPPSGASQMVLRAAGTLSRPITTALLACALLLLLAAAAATGGDADSKMFALPRRAGSRYITRTVTRDTSELKRVDSGEQIATPRAHHAPSGWPTGGLDAGARTGGDPEVQDPADKEAYIRELLREVERQTTEMASGNLQWARGVGLPELIAGIPSPDTRIQLLHEVLEEQKEVRVRVASPLSPVSICPELHRPSHWHRAWSCHVAGPGNLATLPHLLAPPRRSRLASTTICDPSSATENSRCIHSDWFWIKQTNKAPKVHHRPYCSRAAVARIAHCR